MRALTRIAAAVATILCGCSAGNEADQAHDHVGRTIQPVIAGSPSTAEHDAVVVLALFRDGARLGLCSATLVAPNLVLTARHCVSDVDEQAGCYTDGTPIAGAGLHGDHPASEVAVYVPKNGVVTSTADEMLATARGKTLVVDDTATTICNRDLAFVVLDRNVSAPVARLRLGGPKADEDVTVVGWGVTESGTLPSQRMERGGIPLVGAGPMLYPNDQRYGVGDAEFMIGESACLGDSGGPALGPSGAVVGVASRAGNGQARDPNDLAASCTGVNAHAVYTHLGEATPLVARAFLEAGVMPRLEDGPPAARPAYASLEPSKAASSTAAHAGRSAPQALSVSATADATAHEQASDDAGCSAAPRRANGPRPLLAALAIALGVLGLRRRREAQSRNARIGFDAVPVQRSK